MTTNRTDTSVVVTVLAGARKLQRRRRREDGAEGRPRQVLQIHQGLRLRRPQRHRAAQRDPRPLLRQPRKWGATSILSIAIGQEVGVTPVQLVSMVSAIANGGVYIPRRVILLQATPHAQGRSRPHRRGLPPRASTAQRNCRTAHTASSAELDLREDAHP